MVVCRYFEQGRCSRGDTCMFEHAKVAPAWPTPTQRPARAEAPSFRPEGRTHGSTAAGQTNLDASICSFFLRDTCKYGSSCKFNHTDKQSDPMAPKPDVTETPACTFFLRGLCRRGSSCRFRHEDNIARRENTAPSGRSPSPVLTATRVPQTPATLGSGVKATEYDGRVVRKTLSGATVGFGDGVAVQDVLLRSDISTIQLSHVPSDVDARQLTEFLASLGFEHIPAAEIHLRSIPNQAEQVAEVKVEDPSFAENFLRRAGTEPRINGIPLAASVLQVVDAEAGAKRLQLNTVSCAWYKASKVAWLHFDTKPEAVAAIKQLDRQRVQGRTVQSVYQEPPMHAYRSGAPIIHSVQIGNLALRTTAKDLREHLSGSKMNPIKWGPSSYNTPRHMVERILKLRLEEFGPFSDWEVVEDGASVRQRATARFINAEDARQAASSLNNSKISELGNTRIHVSAITSVKLSVQLAILQAVQTDLDELKAQVWESQHVRIKVYDAPAHKVHTTLRIYGDDRKAVARAKGSAERILAGRVATADGAEPIQDAVFFQQAGDALLQSLMEEHSVFIHRDVKKTLLRIYGRPAAVTNAEAALRRHHPQLARTTHTIALTPKTLRMGLHGGFKQLVESFGREAVKIDIASTPKTVTIHGPGSDYEKALGILTTATSEDNSGTDQLCAVCWTAPEDPVRPGRCGHAYCRSCLASQCSSSFSSATATTPAGAGAAAIRCLGIDDGSKTCDEVLTLQALSDALPSAAAFDAVLQKAFAAYVRARPDEFQFCPTPDCDRVYRCRGDGRTVLCDECLMDVCTTCHVAAHYGLSCAEARDLGSEGEQAFKRWSKENDARPCPKCGAVIEKTYGCNHMACKCGAHICWFCMKLFTNSHDTYVHMADH